MAWNGSDKVGSSVPLDRKVKGQRSEVEQRKDKFHSSTSNFNYKRGALGGLIVVALGCGAIWWFVGGRGATRHTEAGPRVPRDRAIAEVAPQIATNEVEEPVVETKPKERPPQKIGEIRDGYILLANGKLDRYANVHTNHTAALKPKYHIFEHFSENAIATILALEPGKSIDGGMPRFNGRLTADFLESLKTPIVPSKDDSDYDRELKRAMNEAKIELKAAYDRGEDIEKIIGDARAELQRLYEYKRSVESMMHKEMRACKTEADMDSYIEAANKMLEAKGIAPLNPGRLMRIKMRMQQRKEN